MGMSKEETKVLSEMKPLLEMYNTTKPENEKFMLFELKQENEQLKRMVEDYEDKLRELVNNTVTDYVGKYIPDARNTTTK